MTDRDSDGTTGEVDPNSPDAPAGPRDPSGSIDSGDPTDRPEGRAADDRTGPHHESDRDAPFADLSADVEARRRRRAEADDPFEAVDVPEFDGDVWEALETDDGAAVSLDGEATRVGGDDRPEHVVNKREYCQQCPNLAAPPALACTNGGTTIVEVLAGDELRVRGCPMVDGADDSGSG